MTCDSLNQYIGLRDAVSRRRIGQEKFGFAVDRGQHSSLDALARLIDWVPIDQALCVISCSAKGESAWPPEALFKAMLLSIWYDLSDVKLAEALHDRGWRYQKRFAA
ncbi:transposase [Mesorhizobium sp. M1066]|uniref:Transposase n=1 Tax=Mesorhizobium opportunistum TaxID=593909 RepID=A0ABV1YRT6_9HYPH